MLNGFPGTNRWMGARAGIGLGIFSMTVIILCKCSNFISYSVCLLKPEFVETRKDGAMFLSNCLFF